MALILDCPSGSIIKRGDAMAERVRVTKEGQIAKPLKDDLQDWLQEGWELLKKPEPTKGADK